VTFIETFEAFKLNQVKGKKMTLMEYFENSFDEDFEFFTTSQFQDVYLKLMQSRKFVGLDLVVHEKSRMEFIQILLKELDTSLFSHLSDQELIWIYMLYVRVKNQELQRIISGILFRFDFKRSSPCVTSVPSCLMFGRISFIYFYPWR